MENRIRMTVSQPATAAADWGQEDSRKVAWSAINLCWHVYFLFRPYLHYLFTPSVQQFEYNFNGQHPFFLGHRLEVSLSMQIPFWTFYLRRKGPVGLLTAVAEWYSTAARAGKMPKDPHFSLICSDFSIIDHSTVLLWSLHARPYTINFGASFWYTDSLIC